MAQKLCDLTIVKKKRVKGREKRGQGGEEGRRGGGKGRDARDFRETHRLHEPQIDATKCEPAVPPLDLPRPRERLSCATFRVA